ncbi:MAG TPA: hypothetical protein VIB99_10705 [Candidatus Limnocylindrales bacterium]|jgi:hypothetical protein
MSRALGRHVALLVGSLSLILVLAGCGTKTADLPVPSPANFPGIVAALSDAGIDVNQQVSGDAGCNDPKLVPTAIGFTASGLDQAAPVRIHIYIFADSATWNRLSIEVATCAQSFVTDPATYESLDPSPYIATGQGPWGSQFRAALQKVLTTAAGDGGNGSDGGGGGNP